MTKKHFTLLFLTFANFCFAQKSLTGTITAVNAKVVTLKYEGESAFSKSDSCIISKDISGSKNPFGIKISSGWLGVGNGVITTVEKNKLTLKITKETSNIVINGKKTDHFVLGKILKLE